MKSLFRLLAILALTVTGSFAQITFVQGGKTGYKELTAVSCPAETNTANNLLLAAIYAASPSVTVGVTDTMGNTWNALTTDTSSYGQVKLFYAIAKSTASNTISASQTSGSLSFGLFCSEWSGNATSGVLDVQTAANATSQTANMSSGNLTTTGSSDLLYCVFADINNGAMTIGTGFTQDEIDTGFGSLSEYKKNLTAGSYSCTATDTAPSSYWLAYAAAFKASNSSPAVISISPNSGTISGGTPVTITGTGFLSGATVTLGGTAATSVTVVSSTSITATTPAHAAGAVNVVVTDSNGSGTLTNGFTYGSPAPTVISISPNSGTTAGGTPVTITGTGFISGSTVTIGGTAATGVTVVSSTSITAATPAHAAGAATVVVSNSNGSGQLTNGFTYTSGSSSIGFVQVAEATPQTPQSSVSVSYSQSQTAGDLNIVVVGWNDTTATVQSVTDSQGNTYTLATGPLKGTGLTQSIYYAKNIRGGSNSVTATFSQAAVFPDIRITEYKGLSTTSPLDKVAGVAGTSGNNASVSSGSATTTSANELIFGSAITTGAFTTAGTGFTKEVIDSDGNIVEDETVSSTGSYAATATLGAYGSQNWIMQMATFVGSSGGGSAPTVISISPNSGTTAGATPVTITGTGFISGSTVTIGGAAATSVTVVSSTSITAYTPAGSAGAATVVVSNSNGSGQLTNGFTYTTAATPVISSISPDQAPVGMAVTISGSNFGTSRGTVTFNGTPASPTTWTATSITVDVPSGSTSGNVIVTAGGVASAGYSFTVGPFALNVVNSVTYSLTNVPVGSLTQVVYGSGDSDNFTPDPNTGRMNGYQFSMSSQTDTGTLTWNANGTLGQLQIADQINPSHSQTCQYAYDDLSRIASYSCPTFSQGFAYDPFGNITKSGSILFQPGYLESSNHEVGVSYDANGNPLNDQSFIYTYDSDGHPITMAPVGGATVTYIYDALGRVAESQASGNVETVYDPTGGKFATVNGSTLNAGYVGLTGGGTAVWSASGLSFYRHTDWQGSSRLATTQARTAYSDVGYAPFGETQTSSGTADLMFASLPQIDTPGLYDAVNRKYSAAQGRWPASDPAGLAATDPTNPQSWNRYAYVLNNPLAMVDPLGLENDCGGPCTPGWSDIGGGCLQFISYSRGENGGYDIPNFGDIVCVPARNSGPPPAIRNAQNPSSGTAANNTQETKLHCTNRIANGISVAGVIESSFDTSKHPYATWALDAFAGNTFSGLGSIPEDFQTNPYKTYGDIVGGGLSQGLPVVGEAMAKAGVPSLLAKGAFGIATDTALAATPLGWGKFGFDALVYAGSALYCVAK